MELDAKTFEWFIGARALKFPITNSTITKKTEEIRDEIVDEEEDQSTL